MSILLNYTLAYRGAEVPALDSYRYRYSLVPCFFAYLQPERRFIDLSAESMVMEQMLSPFGGNPSPASLRNGTGMALVINLMEVPKSYNSTTGSSQAMILNPLD